MTPRRPPATPLPPPSDVPRITIPTGVLPGLASIIRHPFLPKER